MKKVFEKVFISKAFVRKTTHRVRVHIFKNKKADASDVQHCFDLYKKFLAIFYGESSCGNVFES